MNARIFRRRRGLWPVFIPSPEPTLPDPASLPDGFGLLPGATAVLTYDPPPPPPPAAACNSSQLPDAPAPPSDSPRPSTCQRANVPNVPSLPASRTLPTSNIEPRTSKSDEVNSTESRSCIKPPGEGVSPSLVQPPAPETCFHIDARGRRCRMFLARNHSSLCAHHARQARRHGQPDNEALAAELLSGVHDFSTTPDVHIFIANVVRQFARKRIDRLDAIALAYMGQLLLNGRAAINRELQLEQDQEPRVIVNTSLPERKDGSGGQSTA